MSSVPESVAVRHRGSYDFETHYCNLCALQDTVPLVEVKAHLQQGVLDINSDKIRLVDWNPILNTIRINKSLRFIAIRSYFRQSVDKDGNAVKAHYFKRRPPAIRSKDLTLRLAQTLTECLKQTENLKCLDLQGIPFRQKDLFSLSKGLSKNQTLTHVSLEYCQMGDKGCEMISESLKQHPSLSHLNYSGCNLSWKSAEVVSKLIKHQSTERHSETWVHSLRYRHPNLDTMTGLRRITLNCNPMIGDEGIHILSDALKDDLWLKALDLQVCGIGRDGANVLLETLKQNQTLCVLDVRFNPLIDQPLLHKLLGKVLINSNGYDEKAFPWIIAEEPKDPYHTRPRKRIKQISTAYGKKSSLRKSGRSNRTPESRQYISPGSKGCVPWRTAYRASQYKLIYGNKERIGKPRYLQNAEFGRVTIEVGHNNESSSDEEDLLPVAETATPQKHEGSKNIQDSPITVAVRSYDEKIRQLKIDLVSAQRTVAEERKIRHLAEQHAMNLEVENVRLKKELHEEREVNSMRSVIDDEALLESIETSFNKFHDFLDLLKQLGLGGLVAYAGVNDIQFPDIANNRNQNGSSNRQRSKSRKDTRSLRSSSSEKASHRSSSRSARQRESVPRESLETNEVLTPAPITIHQKAKNSGDARQRDRGDFRRSSSETESHKKRSRKSSRDRNSLSQGESIATGPASTHSSKKDVSLHETTTSDRK